MQTEISNAPLMPAPEKGIFIFKKGKTMEAQTVIETKTEPVKSAPKKVNRLKGIDPKAAEPSRPKVLIFGKPGVGKTWTALDFPSVYYIDTEAGADLDRYTDKLKKSGGVYFGPEQGSQDFKTIIEEVKILATEEHPYKTLVIDSISKLYNIEIANEQERLIKAGKEDGYGASKKSGISYTRRLLNWIDRLDMNVILIAHEKDKYVDNKQTGVTFDAWDKLEYELHLCLNIIKTGESRRALVRKTRLEGFPDAANFTWSYDEFARRYGQDVIEKISKQIVLATEQQINDVKRLLEIVKMADGDAEKWFTKAKVSCFEEMDTDTIAKCITYLKNRLQ